MIIKNKWTKEERMTETKGMMKVKKREIRKWGEQKRRNKKESKTERINVEMKEEKKIKEANDNSVYAANWNFFSSLKHKSNPPTSLSRKKHQTAIFIFRMSRAIPSTLPCHITGQAQAVHCVWHDKFIEGSFVKLAVCDDVWKTEL
jgi:hypothetical protein